MDGRSEKLAPRPRVRFERPALPADVVARIRRERIDPRPSQWDYLHLAGLRRGLIAAFARVQADGGHGPVLDVFCGTKPYDALAPWEPVVGLDIDRHFGQADVVGDLPLPFADATFGVALCTQALHMVDDPVWTVTELARVLVDSGHAIVTIPHLFLAEGAFERHWSVHDLASLFTGWEQVAIHRVDGPGAAGAFVLGRIALLGAQRWRLARALFTPAVVAFNLAGVVVDSVVPPLRRRWPHSLVLVARRTPRA